MRAVASANDQRYLARLRTHWKAHKSFPSLAKLDDQLGMSSTVAATQSGKGNLTAAC